jgi:hypothetical protein
MSSSQILTYLLVILVFLIFLSIIFIGVLLVTVFEVERTNSESIKAFCQDTQSYLDYQTSLPLTPPSTYDTPTAAFLLTTDLNVTFSNCPQLPEVVDPPGFDIRKSFSTKVRGAERQLGYFFHDSKNRRSLVSFTGTFFFDEWEIDLEAFQVAPADLNGFQPGMLVHEGFYSIYLGVREALLSIWEEFSSKTNVLWISGHSLGGAIAILMAFDFSASNPVVYTFASPRVGNVVFGHRYSSLNPNTQRVFNTSDVVPDLPPPIFDTFIYQHVGVNIPFTKNLGTLTQNHIQAYEEFLSLTPSST